MVVKNDQSEWCVQFLKPDTAHIVIIAGINEMDPICIKFLQLLPQSLHCISIAIAVASRKFLYLHPGNFFSLYFSGLPELLLFVDS